MSVSIGPLRGCLARPLHWDAASSSGCSDLPVQTAGVQASSLQSERTGCSPPPPRAGSEEKGCSCSRRKCG